jgi:SPASM domain peptide maturase of grasp-with-spasm system
MITNEIQETDEFYFLFHANCILVKDNVGCSIYDLHKHNIYRFGTIVFEVFNKCDDKTIKKLMDTFGGNYNEGILKYINYFIENDFGVLVSEPKLFPRINFEYERPHVIMNAVVEITNQNNYNIINVLQQLSTLHCRDLQLRLYSPESLKIVTKIFEYLIPDKFRSIEILYEYSTGQDELINFIINELPNIFRFIVFDKQGLMGEVKHNKIISSNNNLDQSTKAFYDVNDFEINIDTYSEALNYNIGLNKKVSITKEGFIKNYLSHNLDFGNVDDVNLIDVVKSDQFRLKWEIKNDDIEQCKDCIYRYCCLSCSDIYLKDQKYFKVEYCNGLNK